ncbi:MAG TPA: FkbM family methyltransferase [Thermoanaerobaculia bacterium]
MSGDPLIRRLGRLATRALLAPGIRDLPGVRALYARLYVFGKTLAEPRERRFLREQAEPGMVIFDVGANIGFYTLLLAKRVGPSGRVHAFEPDPLSFAILSRRARRPNVELNPTAAGDRTGRITLFTHRSNRADNRVHDSLGGETAESVDVRLTTLDDYCAARGIDRIDAVKMDIQGAEVAALTGFRKELGRLKPRWMLIEFSPEHLRGAGSSPEAFWKILYEVGFEPWGFDEDGKVFRIEDREAFSRAYEDGYTDVWAKSRFAGSG